MPKRAPRPAEKNLRRAAITDLKRLSMIVCVDEGPGCGIRLIVAGPGRGAGWRIWAGDDPGTGRDSHLAGEVAAATEIRRKFELARSRDRPGSSNSIRQIGDFFVALAGNGDRTAIGSTT